MGYSEPARTAALPHPIAGVLANRIEPEIPELRDHDLTSRLDVATAIRGQGSIGCVAAKGTGQDPRMRR
jgi:hypothetical protein